MEVWTLIVLLLGYCEEILRAHFNPCVFLAQPSNTEVTWYFSESELKLNQWCCLNCVLRFRFEDCPCSVYRSVSDVCSLGPLLHQHARLQGVQRIAHFLDPDSTQFFLYKAHFLWCVKPSSKYNISLSSILLFLYVYENIPYVYVNIPCQDV